MVIPVVYQLPLFPFEKRCTTCGITRCITEFTPQRRSSDGFEHWCKPCRNAYYVAYRDGKRLRRSKPDGFHVCSGCKALLPLSAFGSNKGKTRGRQTYCKACRAERHHAIERFGPTYRATNARLKHRRRSREAAAECTLTEAEWRAIIAQQGYRCLACERPFSDTLPPTRDHIIPVTRGGGLTAANVVALCGPCNSSKGARTIDYRDRAP